MPHQDSPKPAVSDLKAAILATLQRASAKTLSPPEIAQAIAPDSQWHALLVPIRRAAVELAQAGDVVIFRKGKAVDPNDFKGVYRIGLAADKSAPSTS